MPLPERLAGSDWATREVQSLWPLGWKPTSIPDDKRIMNQDLTQNSKQPTNEG